MEELNSLSPDHDPDAPLIVRLRFLLHRAWRADVPAEMQDPVDPPVVGRRVTDEVELLEETREDVTVICY